MPKPKAYSYVRFSTPEQRKGRSLERQHEKAIAYAHKHKLDLDNSKTYYDLGVSGFKGKNRDAALGAFLKAVEVGEILSGSYLLVESLDRLSRDKVLDALSQLQEIIKQGIIVVTLLDNRVYNEDGLNDFSNLIISLSIMYRANEESESKSSRIRDAWKSKKDRARNNAEAISMWCPAWLRLSDDRSEYEIVKERAETVKRIFTMSIAGVGYVRIATIFNEEGIPVFGRSNGWHHSYIHKIIHNDATIGTYRPMKETRENGKRVRVPDGEPIENYYPPVIESVDFLQVQAIKHGSKRPRGRTGRRFSNLLTGLVYCGNCGGSMQYIGKGKPPKGRPYLACSNARRSINDCTTPSV